MKISKLPTTCPSCDKNLMVTKLHCLECDTKIEGIFAIPPLISLNQDEQKFVLEFVKQSGSLKNMEKTLKLSYPTIRNRLDGIIKKLS